MCDVLWIDSLAWAVVPNLGWNTTKCEGEQGVCTQGGEGTGEGLDVVLNTPIILIVSRAHFPAQ